MQPELRLAVVDVELIVSGVAVVDGLSLAVELRFQVIDKRLGGDRQTHLFAVVGECGGAVGKR